MDFPFSAIGGLIGSGLQFLGGSNAQAQQNQQFQAQQQMAREQLQFQMDAAKQGIQWRVADAKAAGISPLVGLGAPTFNPSPIALQGGSFDNPMAGMATSLGNAGQDISEAVGRGLTAAQRAELAMKTQQLSETSRLNDAQTNMLNAQANYYNSRSMQTPAIPSAVGDYGQVIPGQGNSRGVIVGPTLSGAGGYQNKLPETDTRDPNNPGSVSGRPGPAVNWRRSNDGGLNAEPTPGSVAGTIGGPEYTNWAWRNRLPAYWTDSVGPSMDKVRTEFPKATGVYFNPWNETWYPLYNGEKAPWHSRRAW